VIRFLKRYPDYLLFGVLTAMFSGPGQTFLVSIFLPHLQQEFNLSHSEISYLYSGATLASALSLPWLGKVLDRAHLTRFTLMAGSLLALGCMILGFASNLFMVFVGFFLIRNQGQGVLSLTSSTTMVRMFGKMRGKALGIANVGYPLSEALFPLGVVFWIERYGWRSGWIMLSFIILLIFLPVILVLLKSYPEKAKQIHKENEILYEKEATESPSRLRHYSLKEVLGDPRFYLLLPALLIPPFYLTALFLHQIELITLKSWDPRLIAIGFSIFAIFRFPVSIIVGPLIDKYTARTLFPWALVPMVFGLLSFWVGTNSFWIVPYFALCGISMGLGMTISGALWAEMYGTRYLGSIRGFMYSAMVFSTAVAPTVLGVLLDWNTSLGMIFGVIILFNICSIILSFVACRIRPT